MKLEYLTKCGICGKEFRNYAGLSKHISQAHPGVSNQSYYDEYMKEPGEGVCGHCGKPTGFSGRLNRGYFTHCSTKCTASDRNTEEKRKATKLALYGDATFNNHDKTSQTKLERYGDANYANGDQIRATKLERYGIAGFNNVAKREATKLERFGDANFANPAKGMATKAERYGDAHYNNSAKMQETKLEKYGDSAYVNVEKAKDTVYRKTVMRYRVALEEQCDVLEYADRKFRCRCRKCGNEFEIPITTGYMRLYSYGTVWCTRCRPAETSRSKEEVALYEYVGSLMGEGKVTRSYRALGLEVDIYIPDRKLGIEFDGLYWHDERRKPPTYHLMKTELCEENGIRLLHVYEDEWQYRKDIVKSRICGILGMNRRVHARKCDVREVESGESDRFLDDNHLQGACVSSWRYGLYYREELVALMTFGRNRFGDGIELLRFCTQKFVSVLGGASRLFKRFVEEHPEVEEIVSYADRRWSGSEAFYPKLGFENAGASRPSYYYVIGNTRHNRLEFTKQNLVAAGYPEGMSEHDIMLSRGIYRIYDCGNWRYVWHRK